MPRAELMVYLTKFIRITPAGMEIMVRIIGISLLMKIPVAPLVLIRSKFFPDDWFMFGETFQIAVQKQVPAHPADAV